MYNTSMLPSKVMPYLFWLAAPLMDSSIVQKQKGRTYHREGYWIMNLFPTPLLICWTTHCASLSSKAYPRAILDSRISVGPTFIIFGFFSRSYCLIKVWTLWEGHKIWKKIPLSIWRYSVASNFKWKIFSNCVTFSEGPNFKRPYVYWI